MKIDLLLIFNTMGVRFESKDTEGLIFRQIRAKANDYFSRTNQSRHANAKLWAKVLIQTAIMISAVVAIFSCSSFWVLSFSYTILGLILVILGINLGHDAAHHCITGNRKLDDFLFEFTYALQGSAGYVYQMRHNHAHHIYPNIFDNDTDLELTPLVILNPKRQFRSIHKYQHVYASFLYIFVTIFYLFVEDIKHYVHFGKSHFKNKTIPPFEWAKLVFIKLMYVVNFLLLPTLFTDFTFLQILGAFLIMHAITSLFLTFTFFISHHVEEVNYVRADEQTLTIPTSWAEHQIRTTIDFHPNSEIAHFLFGGFNTHIAHHLFPETCHIHYPALNEIIKETLNENGVGHWYKSFTFFEGVRSHLSHLKKTSREIEGMQLVDGSW